MAVTFSQSLQHSDVSVLIVYRSFNLCSPCTLMKYICLSHNFIIERGHRECLVFSLLVSTYYLWKAKVTGMKIYPHMKVYLITSGSQGALPNNIAPQTSHPSAALSGLSGTCPFWKHLCVLLSLHRWPSPTLSFPFWNRKYWAFVRCFILISIVTTLPERHSGTSGCVSFSAYTNSDLKVVLSLHCGIL